MLRARDLRLAGHQVTVFEALPVAGQIKQLHVLPDGRKASATNVIERIDNDTFTWQSIGRAVDGEILPNIEAITVKRAASE